uniref:DUF5641 domain-containing protein n=1 Tax=Cacopsylla melanoneura TaxID=428564 RepID=A0A8D9A137_9HEMI
MQSSTNMCNVLMYTLLVNIKGPSGKTRKARLLIDTGSQRSYALEGTMVDMGYSPTGKERIQHALFGVVLGLIFVLGLMKELLRRVLGRTSVDYFELQTIICECESVMNSRPLTYLSEDSTDLCCITPAMFLQDLQEIDMPEAELIHSADLGRKPKHSQELRRQILERFRLEYLGKLQLFANTKKTHELKVNDLVFVGDDNSKRINWPVGRIVELINGVDGHVRVVKVRIGSGVLTRPVQRVYPLELNCSPDEMSPILEQNVEPIPINVVPEIHQVPIESVPDVDQSVSETEPTKPLIVSQRFTRHGRAVRTPFKLTL